MKNCYLLLILIFSTLAVYGQTNRNQWIIEYSPNFSSETEPCSDAPMELSHNAFVKWLTPLSQNAQFTAGIGILNRTSEAFVGTWAPTQKGEIENFLVLPTGLRIKLNKFFIHPEVGIGYRFQNTQRTFSEYNEGFIESRQDETDKGQKFTVPFFLSFGYEFRFSSASLLVGLKSYADILTENQHWYHGHFYGHGMVAAIQF